jgi:hypothetical protein
MLVVTRKTEMGDKAEDVVDSEIVAGLPQSPPLLRVKK